MGVAEEWEAFGVLRCIMRLGRDPTHPTALSVPTSIRNTSKIARSVRHDWNVENPENGVMDADFD